VVTRDREAGELRTRTETSGRNGTAKVRDKKDQLRLFNPLRADPYGGKAPSVDTDTSRDAADSIQGVLNAMQSRVLHWIRTQGTDGSTCDEAEVALAMKHQTCSARIRELSLKERILDSGMRRRTRSNRKAIVYVVPEFHPDIV